MVAGTAATAPAQCDTLATVCWGDFKKLCRAGVTFLPVSVEVDMC